MGFPCFTVVVKPLPAFCTISTVLFNYPVSLLTPNRGSRQNYFPDIKTACSSHKSIGLCRHDAGPAQVAVIAVLAGYSGFTGVNSTFLSLK
jgi:hypothetical protein